MLQIAREIAAAVTQLAWSACPSFEHMLVSSPDEEALEDDFAQGEAFLISD